MKDYRKQKSDNPKNVEMINESNDSKKRDPKNAETTDEVYCICRKEDDGSQMIICNSCKEWFNIKCVHITEKDVPDMNIRSEEY